MSDTYLIYSLQARIASKYEDYGEEWLRTVFDFSHSQVNEALVRQLHRCEFLENANNVVLVGGPGSRQDPHCLSPRGTSH